MHLELLLIAECVVIYLPTEDVCQIRIAPVKLLSTEESRHFGATTILLTVIQLISLLFRVHPMNWLSKTTCCSPKQSVDSGVYLTPTKNIYPAHPRSE